MNYTGAMQNMDRRVTAANAERHLKPTQYNKQKHCGEYESGAGAIVNVWWLW